MIQVLENGDLLVPDPSNTNAYLEAVRTVHPTDADYDELRALADELGPAVTRVHKGGPGSGHHHHQGIPGHRGGSLPGHGATTAPPKPALAAPPEVASPPPEASSGVAALQAAGIELPRYDADTNIGKRELAFLQHFSSQHVDDGIEVGRLFDSNGNVGYSITSSAEKYVTLPDEYRKSMKDGVFVHNHPSGVGLSLADMAVAADTDARAIASVGRSSIFGTPTLHLVSRPLSGWPTPRALEAAHTRLQAAAMKRFEPLVATGKISSKVAWDAHKSIVLRGLASEGLIKYERIKLPEAVKKQAGDDEPVYIPEEDGYPLDKDETNPYDDIRVRKGGPGSGYHGPRPGTGREGQVGGSKPEGGAPIAETEDEVLRRAKEKGLDPLIEELTKTEAAEEAIPGSLHAPDLRANALRIAVDGRVQYGIGPANQASAETTTFLKDVAAHEAVLHEMPLVHGTTPQAAAMMWKEGIKSNGILLSATNARMDELRAKSKNKWFNKLTSPEKSELLDLQQRLLSTGTTHAPDRASGLDQFAFFRHGTVTTGYEKGVTVLVDNRLMDEHGWATQDDIVASRYKGPRLEPDEYTSDHLLNYGHDAVSDGGYWKAAAAKRAGIFKDNTFPQTADASFEVKVPPVPRNRILGFVLHDTLVNDLPDRSASYAALKAAGVPDSMIFQSTDDLSQLRKLYRQVQQGAK